jgi:hypothetical protein
MLGAGVVNELPLHHNLKSPIFGRRKNFVLNEVACATNDEQSHRVGRDLPQPIAKRCLHPSYRERHLRKQDWEQTQHQTMTPFLPIIGSHHTLKWRFAHAMALSIVLLNCRVGILTNAMLLLSLCSAALGLLEAGWRFLCSFGQSILPSCGR